MHPESGRSRTGLKPGMLFGAAVRHSDGTKQKPIQTTQNKKGLLSVKSMKLSTRILARTAVVALVAASAAFFAGCGKKEDDAAKKEEAAKKEAAARKEEAAKELKAAKDAIKEKKFEDAAKSLQSASDKDDSEATLMLAFLYGAGKGVEKDEDKATALLKKSADAGNVKAKFLSAMKEIEDSGKEPDEAARKQLGDIGAELKPLAEAGDGDAQALYALSLLSQLDPSKPEELKKIVEEVQMWSEKAQENGSFFANLKEEN